MRYKKKSEFSNKGRAMEWLLLGLFLATALYLGWKNLTQKPDAMRRESEDFNRKYYRDKTPRHH